MMAPAPAAAFELSGGVSLGGVLAGTKSRFAASPHAGISWRMGSGWLFAIHEMFSILPAINQHGVGVHNQTSASLGYAFEKGQLSLGPSLSFYSIPACNSAVCARVAGFSPGVYAQANAYFAERLGVSVSGNVDWIAGSGGALLGGVVAMVVAGPILRWSTK
jgi:hypothetical protein